MSFFRSKQKPDYTGLQIQTATNTLPVPIAYGRSRLAPNALWYDNFTTSSAKGGKGGLFSSDTYDYKAAIILGLCEGPIGSIGTIWKDQSTYSLSSLGLSLFDGSTPQTVWSYLTSAYPSQALAYQGTAFVCAADYDLGDAATIDNHNFEVFGILDGTGVNGVDADPAQVVSDFLTNAQYGVGFPAGSINAASLFGSGGDASYQTYCKAVGLCFSPCMTDQESAQSILTRWLQLTNTAAVWTGGEIKFIPYGDTATTVGAVTTIVQTRQINAPPVPESGPTPPPSITVCAAALFVSDLGVTYAQTGVALTFVNTTPTSKGTYSLSPGGTYLFAPRDENTLVRITYNYAVAASYVPDLTPVYSLTDDDVIYDEGEDPIKVTRSDPYSCCNVWRLEISARDNGYALGPIESRDQDAIERYGLRVSSSVSAHEICDENVAAITGQLMLQRALYIRNTFKFKLSWEFCLLDPMDIVEIADANLGFSNYAIRITEIEEADDGLLTVTAEELTVGVGSAPLYPTQGGVVALINRNVAAAPVNTPIIFEPPGGLVSDSEVWIAASGGNAGVTDPNWGGCNVYLSLDSTTFTQIGSVEAPARQGVLTAPLGAFASANPDSGDMVALNMVESAGELATATDLDAQLANTLCILDGELFSYATAMLTSANNYALTYLYRGLYGTAAAAHSIGAPFARLDNAIFKYTLPAQYIGQTLYIKLQSFNIFGGGAQDISTCVIYSYVPTGAALDHPVARSLLVATMMDFGSVGSAAPIEDDFGTPVLAVDIDVDLGTA